MVFLDDEIQLAQKYQSEDIFTSQESGKAILNRSCERDAKDDSFNKDKRLGVFSIASRNLDDTSITRTLSSSDKISEITDTQTFVNVSTTMFDTILVYNNVTNIFNLFVSFLSSHVCVF